MGRKYSMFLVWGSTARAVRVPKWFYVAWRRIRGKGKRSYMMLEGGPSQALCSEDNCPEPPVGQFAVLGYEELRVVDLCAKHAQQAKQPGTEVSFLRTGIELFFCIVLVMFFQVCARLRWLHLTRQ